MFASNFHHLAWMEKALRVEIFSPSAMKIPKQDLQLGQVTLKLQKTVMLTCYPVSIHLRRLDFNLSLSSFKFFLILTIYWMQPTASMSEYVETFPEKWPNTFASFLKPAKNWFFFIYDLLFRFVLLKSINEFWHTKQMEGKKEDDSTASHRTFLFLKYINQFN